MGEMTNDEAHLEVRTTGKREMRTKAPVGRIFCC